jgi:hypothetical protein
MTASGEGAQTKSGVVRSRIDAGQAFWHRQGPPGTGDQGHRGTAAGYRLVPAWGETDVGANRYHEPAHGSNLDWTRLDTGHRT